jgi:hypothetical protein
MTNHCIDLYDLALLINYERTAREPRFRHGKLREVIHNGAKPKSVIWRPEVLWFASKTPTKVGYIFDKEFNDQNQDEPDTPGNMLPAPPRPYLPPDLTYKQLEAIFYQARAHDACYASVFIMQELFDMIPGTVFLRVRTQSGLHREFVTPAHERMIYEGELRNPKLMLDNSVITHTSVGDTSMFEDLGHNGRGHRLSHGMSYISGEAPRMNHAVLGFYDPDTDQMLYMPNVILDLSSIQFGVAGRGAKGNSLFVLETFEEYQARMRKFSDGMDPATIRVSQLVTPPVDRGQEEFQRSVAKRVWERWCKRDTEHWCGHCGAPATQRCGKCQNMYFCNQEHSVAAWPMHKRMCK